MDTLFLGLIVTGLSVYVFYLEKRISRLEDNQKDSKCIKWFQKALA